VLTSRRNRNYYDDSQKIPRHCGTLVRKQNRQNALQFWEVDLEKGSGAAYKEQNVNLIMELIKWL
jgi:hypothetical protein